MKHNTSNIWTNAVDLAKHINMLNEKGYDYRISIVKGIDNEDVVKVDVIVEEEED